MRDRLADRNSVDSDPQVANILPRSLMETEWLTPPPTPDPPDRVPHLRDPSAPPGRPHRHRRTPAEEAFSWVSESASRLVPPSPCFSPHRVARTRVGHCDAAVTGSRPRRAMPGRISATSCRVRSAPFDANGKRLAAWETTNRTAIDLGFVRTGYFRSARAAAALSL